MTPNATEFRRHAVAPWECIKEGWELIKDQYWLFFGISLVALLVGGLVPIVLLGPMMVGVFLCIQQKQRNQPVEFGLLFKGFDQFVAGLVVTVIKVIPIIIILIPYYILLIATMATSMPRNGSPDDSRAFLISLFGIEAIFGVTVMIVSILIEIFFMFAFPLVADRKMSGLDAIKLSFRAAKANAGGVLGLILLNGLFTMLGVLCCFIGVYFYLPVAFAAQAIAYRRVFPDVGPSFSSPPPPPGSWA